MHLLTSGGKALACLASLLVVSLVSPSGRAAAATVAASPSSAGVGPGVRDVVEFTKLIRHSHSMRVEHKLAVSPDRARVLAVTRKASVERGTNTYEFLLLDADPERLARGQPQPPRSLLSFEGANDNNNSEPFVQEARWLDDRTIAFRARMEGAPFQVYTIDVPTGRLLQCTFETQPVLSFGIAADRSRVVYAVRVPNPPYAAEDRSVVVGSQSFFSISFGTSHAPSQRLRYRYAVNELGKQAPGRPLGGPVEGIAAPFMPNISVSPDGKWALIPRYEQSRHLEWAARYPLMGETANRFGPALSLDPQGYFIRPRQWLARRNIAHGLDDATERPVLEAPDDSTPGTPSRVDTMWTARGSVIVAGTHLPLAPGSSDPSRTASHVIEYWPQSGRFEIIAALGARLDSLRPGAGGRVFTLQLEGSPPRSFEQTAAGDWTPVELPVPEPVDGDRLGYPLAAGWKVLIDQALNRPADVVAVDPGGRRIPLTHLNPQFSASSWGSMAVYEWQDANGKRYAGGLMVPADHDPSRRYPVVIQTYGFDRERFYLDGSNLTEGWTSGFAGRAFLRQGVLVLALPHSLRERDEPSGLPGMRHDRAALMVGSAIQSLIDRGIADRDRIGIMGWSAWGEFVQNLLTFQHLPIRAASILDGDSNSLWALILTTGHSDFVYRRFEATNAGMPYGPGLEKWVARDPSLHTDCIRAALRIENYGPSSKIHWDTYGLMRRQFKPVEKVVFPHGAHALGHPIDRMISLQGNVDWYSFWLKGEERIAPVMPQESAESLRQQYLRWREMAELKKRDEAKPACRAVATRTD